MCKDDNEIELLTGQYIAVNDQISQLAREPTLSQLLNSVQLPAVAWSKHLARNLRDISEYDRLDNELPVHG